MMETLINDVWGDINPQKIYNTPQTQAAVTFKEQLVTLPSGKVMLESEFKIFDSIMKSVPKPEIAIIPQQAQNQIVAQQPQAVPYQNIPYNTAATIPLNQNGIIALAVVFCMCLLSTVTIIKVWGTTDVAREQQRQEELSAQYRHLGERYDRLAKATEKVGKKADVCVSLFCGDRGNDSNDKQQQDIKPATLSRESNSVSEISLDSDYPAALTEVKQWKANGTSYNDAIAQLNWIRKNQSQYPISASSINQAILATY